MIDFVKSLLTDFDPAAFLPDLNAIFGWLELAMRICVLAAPLSVLGFGLLYLLAAPKEANYKLGYRFFWGMSSVEAWRFTQRLAGIVWTVLGAVLTLVMWSNCGKLLELDAGAMADKAVSYILWELGSTIVSILLINLAVLICFTFKGIPRPFVPAWMYSPWKLKLPTIKK